jgi:putative holliday junction resolvase
MALDIGDKTIGVALSDPGGRIATPLKTIARQNLDKDAGELKRVIADYEVERIVAGLPVLLDGRSTEQTEKTETALRALEKRLSRPIERIDERLSTVAVERVLLEADMSRKRRREVKDHLAAAWMLQGILDLEAGPAPDRDGFDDHGDD